MNHDDESAALAHQQQLEQQEQELINVQEIDNEQHGILEQS